MSSILVFNLLSEKKAMMLPVALISPAIPGAGVFTPNELT